MSLRSACASRADLAPVHRRLVGQTGRWSPDTFGVESMSADSSYSIRPATAADAKAVRMLLQNAAAAMDDCLVAVSGRQPLVVAAAGLTHSQRSKPFVGPGIAVHVIEPFRERGIAQAMVEQLASHAAARGAQA